MLHCGFLSACVPEMLGTGRGCPSPFHRDYLQRGPARLTGTGVLLLQSKASEVSWGFLFLFWQQDKTSLLQKRRFVVLVPQDRALSGHSDTVGPDVSWLCPLSSRERTIPLCLVSISDCLYLHENLLLSGLWISTARILGKSRGWDMKHQLTPCFSHSASRLFSVCLWFFFKGIC